MIFTDIMISLIEVLFISLIAWFLFERYDKKKVKKILEDYDGTKNLSRREPPEDSGIGKGESIVKGSPPTPEQGLLPTTEVRDDGKGSDSTGNNGKGINRIKNFFKKG